MSLVSFDYIDIFRLCKRSSRCCWQSSAS